MTSRGDKKVKSGKESAMDVEIPKEEAVVTVTKLNGITLAGKKLLFDYILFNL